MCAQVLCSRGVSEGGWCRYMWHMLDLPCRRNVEQINHEPSLFPRGLAELFDWSMTTLMTGGSSKWIWVCPWRGKFSNDATGFLSMWNLTSNGILGATLIQIFIIDYICRGSCNMLHLSRMRDELLCCGLQSVSVSCGEVRVWVLISQWITRWQFSLIENLLLLFSKGSLILLFLLLVSSSC